MIPLGCALIPQRRLRSGIAHQTPHLHGRASQRSQRPLTRAPDVIVPMAVSAPVANRVLQFSLAASPLIARTITSAQETNAA